MSELAPLTPRRLVWMLTLLLTLGVAVAVYRIPVQVTDSLELLESVDRTPALTTVFVDALSSSRTMLRPLRQTQSKVLLFLGRIRGSNYTRTFRGFHALAAASLFLMFVAAARPRSWTDVAAVIFALTVLTGLHTTAGMLREAYPINHFLLIAVYAIAILLLARSGGGLLVDTAAVGCFVLAALTLESGLLVLPLATVAFASGRRGISAKALALMWLLGVGYLYLRVGYLQMAGNTVGDGRTGFGLTALDGEAIRARFAQHPFELYAYTIAGSILTVLLSQPVNGTWTVVRGWLDGSLQTFEILNVTTSVAATVLVGWYVCARNPDGRRHLWSSVPLMAITLLVGSAVISYAYAKSEIMSAAGVFYALVVFEAARHLLTRVPTWALPRQLVMVSILALVSSAWSVRALGLQYRLERAAFSARNEWVHNSQRIALDAQASTPLSSSLKQQALRRIASNPNLMPRLVTTLWGEE